MHAELAGPCRLRLASRVPAAAIGSDGPCELGGWFRFAAKDANVGRTIANLIGPVLGRRSPAQVRKPVIRLASRTMACLLTGRTRADEREKDEAVNVAGRPAAIAHEIDRRVAVPEHRPEYDRAVPRADSLAGQAADSP